VTLKRQLQKALAVLVDDEKKCPVVIVDEAPSALQGDAGGKSVSC